MMKTVAALYRTAAVSTILLAAGCSRPIPRPLLEAQQFLRNAPAYQQKSTVEMLLPNGKPDTRHSGLNQLQVVRGGALRTLQVFDGRLVFELITDGRREFGPDENGLMEEEHGDAAKSFADQVHLSLRAVVPSRFDGRAQLAGRENIDGAAASVYTWGSRSSVVVREAPLRWSMVRPDPETTRLWIAEDNHRPLKLQVRVEGPAVQVTTTVFTYDPSVRVVLPGQ
jgi:hypothetical protein